MRLYNDFECTQSTVNMPLVYHIDININVDRGSCDWRNDIIWCAAKSYYIVDGRGWFIGARIGLIAVFVAIAIVIIAI